MNKTFKNFKKKYFIKAVAGSAGIGVSCGLAVAGIIVLALKLSEIAFEPLYCVPAGIGAALLAGGLTFFFVRPTDKRIAAELDKTFELEEKVQTMVEFAGESGGIAEIQREDTSEKLNNLPRKKTEFKKIWQYIAVPVAAAALFVSAIAVPGNNIPADGNRGDQIFVITDFQEHKLKQLISDVDGSSLEDGLKTSILGLLNELLASVKSEMTESVMKSEVKTVIALTDGLVGGVNTYKPINSAFLNSPQTKPLGRVIKNSVTFFRSSGSRINEYAQVESYLTEISDKIDEQVTPYVTDLLKNFDIPKTQTGEKTLAGEITSLTLAMNLALTNSGVDEEDALFSVLSVYSKGLSAVADNSKKEEYTDVGLQQQIKSATDTFRIKMTELLNIQSNNAMMNDFIRHQLASIFKLMLSELPPYDYDSPEREDGSDPGNDENKVNNGGFGKGDVVYGGNDVVFNPATGEYEPYGPLLDPYYAIVIEQIQQGKLPESMISFIENYFGNLYSGIEDPDDAEKN